MISDIMIAADTRTKRGSNEARRLRSSGRIPTCIYGIKQETLSLSVNARELAVILRDEEKRNSIFNLDIAGQKKEFVRIGDLQIHPVTGRVLHADLLRVDIAVKTVVKVPLHLIGEPEGVKLDGGVLERGIRELEIECLPTDIPGHLDVNVKELKVGQHIYASDVELASNLKLVSDSHGVVAVIVAAREEDVPTSVTAASEPEITKKGKAEPEK